MHEWTDFGRRFRITEGEGLEICEQNSTEWYYAGDHYRDWQLYKVVVREVLRLAALTPGGVTGEGEEEKR